MKSFLTARVRFPFAFSFLDYPDKDNMCVSIYFMGCLNNCKYCHNPEFVNPDYSVDTKLFDLEGFIKEVENFTIRSKNRKVSLMGGDPLSKYNIEFTKEFLKYQKYDICIYTGHSVNYVKNNNVVGFKFLKCGKYEENNKIKPLKTERFMSFASSNQILFDSDFNQLSESGVYYF